MTEYDPDHQINRGNRRWETLGAFASALAASLGELVPYLVGGVVLILLIGFTFGITVKAALALAMALLIAMALLAAANS